ncbi:MAG: hypothetical protein Q4F79_11295 [Eubacteriales bacterium]|nr:hypothetical protein [Eubacteriales bacterium]
MDELNLDQFKELIGDLEPSKSTSFRLDDIMKEVAEAQEALNPAQEPIEPEEEPTKLLSEQEEVRSDEEPETEEDETEVIPDDPEPVEETEPEEEPMDEEDSEPEPPKKKHFWDNWVVPEEGDEEAAEQSQPEELTGEDEEPERIRFFASLFEGAKGDAEIAEEDEELAEVFQEKQPKRRFWERWLAPEKLEEDAAPAEETTSVAAGEETIAISMEEPEEEPTQVLESQPTVVFAPVPEDAGEPEASEELEEPSEEDLLYESISHAAEEGEPEHAFDAQPIADLMDEMAEETASEPEEEAPESEAESEEEIPDIDEPEAEEETAEPLEEEEAIEETPEEPEIEEVPELRIRKPKFLDKWFAPIEDVPEERKRTEESEAQPEEKQEPEETIVFEDERPEEPEAAAVPPTEEETFDQSLPEEPEEETEAEPVPDEPEQTISQAEFEAFLREADEEPQPRASFAELMRESGVDWHEDAPQTEAPVVSEDLKSQVVYLELGAKESAPEPEKTPEIEPEPEQRIERPEGKAAVEEPVSKPAKPQAPARPEPIWLRMSLERIGDIAPKVERVNGEPVLMSEIRRLEREKEQLQRKRTEQTAQPAPTVPPMPRPVYPAESETEDDGGDDEVSGGRPDIELESEQRIEHAVVTEEEPEGDWEEPEAAELPDDTEAPRPKRTQQKKSRFARWRERRKRAQEARTRVPKSAKAGYKQWNRTARSTGRRSMLVGVLTLLALYLSCSATMDLPVPEALSYTESMQNFYGVLIGLTVIAMLAAWDVLVDGIKALFHLQMDFCTLITLTLVMTLVHSGLRITIVGEELSYPCVAMAALYALMRARVAQAAAKRNTYKTAALNRAPIGIYLHREPKPHLVKRRLEDNEAFVGCAARDGWHSRFERLYTPLVIVAALVMAWIITTMTEDHGRFVYAFSALLVAASQIGLLTAVALGSSNATQRLMRDDAALAGLGAAIRMADVSQVVMTDGDLFPTGSILVDDYIDIRGSMELDDVLAYAAAVEDDSALGRVLKEKIHQRYGDQVAAHDRVRYKNGGNGARIGDREVLFGTASFMEDMKIPIPALPDQEDHLFLAVDGVTEAVFEVEYVATTQVYTALQALAERRISVLFQAKDCYLSAERLSDLFGLQPGMIHMPDLEQARQISTPEYVEEDILLAILTRDGAAPYSDCVDAAYSLSRLTAGGMLLGTLAAVLDMALMTYLCFVFAPLGASPLRVLLYSLLWFIPIFFIENEAKRG